MEIQELAKTFKGEKEIGEAVLEINKSLSKINDTHERIKKKYQQDTKSEFRDENIVNKNLIIYLLIKNGIKLNRPTQIAGTKYVININSKKLIMQNKSMHIDFTNFLDTLSTLSDIKIKDSVKQFKEYHSISSSINNYGQVYHKQFNETIDIGTCKMSISYNSENREGDKYKLSYIIQNNEGTQLARITLYGGSIVDNHYTNFEFGEKLFTIMDENIIECALMIKKNLYIKLLEYGEMIKKYISLLNEFQLI